MPLTHCHVIVIGAGIGGLTAALSLHRHGFKVSVYEQASELGEFGAGLLVTPNAMHALEFLRIGEVIAATSNVSNELLIRHFQSGKIIHRRPDGHYYKSKYGAGHFQVHRADLHNALKAAVLAHDPDCVHLAHAFGNLVQSESGVSARFVNGLVVEGDALIGCDGYRSAVRDAVYGSAPASYTGQVAFRALISCENELEYFSKQGASMYIGPDRMFLHYPLRKNTLMNVVAISRQPRWEQEGWAISAKAGELLELYQDFHPLVLGMIGAILPETLFKWGLRERNPLEQWTIGRVSTLGDAAHPTSPFLGQGAVMAIEDGMVLGRCFAEAISPEDALLRYERARKHRANAVQIHSRERANALQSSNLEYLGPGRSADDLGLFEYDPTTVPV
jgi:salicylate hydroxylase